MQQSNHSNSSAHSIAAAPDPPARLIVCERTGRWAEVLRRELAASGVRVWETRSLSDCWDELAKSRASFLVLELGGNATELLQRLAELPRAFPAARAAVVADRSMANREWLLREAGAVHFLASPRRAGTLARMIQRHLDQAPAPTLGPAERIWSELPWGK